MTLFCALIREHHFSLVFHQSLMFLKPIFVIDNSLDAEITNHWDLSHPVHRFYTKYFYQIFRFSVLTVKIQLLAQTFLWSSINMFMSDLMLWLWLIVVTRATNAFVTTNRVTWTPQGQVVFLWTRWPPRWGCTSCSEKRLSLVITRILWPLVKHWTVIREFS